jgi:hypothetical protein
VQEVFLTFGDKLTFRLLEFPKALEGKTREFLSYHLSDSPHTPLGQPLTIAHHDPAEVSHLEGTEVLAEPPLIIRENETQTIYEVPGALAWYDDANQTAGISILDPENLAIEHLTRWVLIALMFQLALSRGWLGLHAAGIVTGGRAIVLPGPSESGKTTIFTTALEAGWDVLSDDLSWLCETDSGFRAHAFVRCGAEFKAVAQPSADNIPIAAIVFPAITDEVSNRLVPVDPVEAVKQLASQALWFGGNRTKARCFSAIVRLIRSNPCFTLLAGRDRQTVPELLRTALP